LLNLYHQTAAGFFPLPATADRLIGWVRRFILFHQKRHPRKMAAVEISAFLDHLAKTESLMRLNEAHEALVFLYRDVLRLDVGERPPPRPARLLTPQDVRAALAAGRRLTTGSAEGHVI
jgi:hypothetical protein